MTFQINLEHFCRFCCHFIDWGAMFFLLIAYDCPILRTDTFKLPSCLQVKLIEDRDDIVSVIWPPAGVYISWAIYWILELLKTTTLDSFIIFIMLVFIVVPKSHSYCVLTLPQIFCVYLYFVWSSKTRTWWLPIYFEKSNEITGIINNNWLLWNIL